MYRLREPRNAAIVGVLLAVAIVVVFLLVNNDSGSSNPKPTNGAQAASLQHLRDVASSVDHPVYWAGPRPGKRYELTVTDQGNIFIRYLNANTPVGSRQVASLTIGTYPVQNAYAATKSIAGRPGARTGSTPDGGFVATSSADLNSVYIAYPNTNQQIEVYDPDAKTAFALATSGAVVPVS